MREKYSLYLGLGTGGLVFLLTLLFAFLQSPETRSLSVKRGFVIPHPVEGYRECDSCHGLKGKYPYPVRHLGWSNRSCVSCHPSLSRKFPET